MPEIVRASLNGTDSNMAPFFVARLGATVLPDEPIRKPDGSLRGPTRSRTGRKAKPKTTVAKKAAGKSTTQQAAKPAENDKE
jgi:hypothetical protein